MKEYTIAASVAVIAAFAVDMLLGTRVVFRSVFWLFMLVIFCFKLAVNGYLTAALIIIYNTRFFSGSRLGSIPLEDFLFGFSMVALTIIFWEHFKKKAA